MRQAVNLLQIQSHGRGLLEVTDEIVRWAASQSMRMGLLTIFCRLTTATRRPSFERVFDLPERVLPAAVLDAPTPEVADAHRELLRIARALGIATAGDLRDYFRLFPADAAPRIADLVDAGELLPARVEGWSQPAYLHAEAKAPRRVDARALLAPFDPLIWERSRTERLFGVRYRPRSTRRRTSACTATMCCLSSWATGSCLAWI